MSTLWNKLWCVILSLAILVNLLLVSALAADAPMEQVVAQHWVEASPVETTENVTQPLVTESAEEAQAVIVREDISLREEFTKHFEMSDGSYTATVYNEPVHQLVDGAWVEVDNTLMLFTSAKGTAKYQTVNGLTDVSFAQSFGNELVTMEQDEHSITWGVEAAVDPMETAAVASAQLIGNLQEPAQAEILPLDLSDVKAEEQKIFTTKATSTIQYADALANGVDLEYTVLPSRIKESIILNSPQSISTYTVTVNTSDLLARLLDNREIEFYTEDGEPIFTMWAPYMYDSASELSEDIEVELTALGNGQYAITLTPDTDWLNSPDRVYPVVIDPDVSVSRARTNIIDNTVMEGQGNQNRNLDRLYIGRKSGACVRAFLKYDVMPTIPFGATITAATQTLYITANTETGSTAGAYIVTDGDWESDTITWATKPAARTTIDATIEHNNFSYYQFSCLNAVQKWYDGSTIGKNANYGITVRYTNESINDYNAFYSADYSVESSRPLLTISYQLSADTITVREGSAYQLALSGVSGTINWTSNNTSIATVNSLGQVTGVKAGTATITASAGGEIQKTYTTYVTIPDGVYYLKNNTGLYLTTNGSAAEYTRAYIQTKQTTNTNKFPQLWRIIHLSQNYYSIRPMHKLNMALHATGNLVDINTIGTGDSLAAVPLANRWQIQYGSNGYAIRYTGSNSMAMRSQENISPGTGVITGTYQSNSYFHWTFESAPGIFLFNSSDHTPYISTPTKTLDRNSYYSLETMKLKVIVSGAPYNDQTVTWSASNSSVGVVTTTGAYAPSKRGTNTIIASKTINGQPYSAQYKIICQETIYVKNYYDETFEGQSELIGYIYDAVDFLNAAYNNQFYLRFEMDSAPQRYPQAGVDRCPYKQLGPCKDDCDEECLLHHKNLDRISEEAYSRYFEPNHVVVLWSDSLEGTFCYKTNDHTPTPDTAMGVTCMRTKAGEPDPWPVAQMLRIPYYNPYYDDNSLSRAYALCTLAHEIAHTLNLREVYDNAYGDNVNHAGDTGVQCVMEQLSSYKLTDFVDAVYRDNEGAFCEYCTYKLLQVAPSNAYES